MTLKVGHVYYDNLYETLMKCIEEDSSQDVTYKMLTVDQHGHNNRFQKHLSQLISKDRLIDLGPGDFKDHPEYIL